LNPLEILLVKFPYLGLSEKETRELFLGTVDLKSHLSGNITGIALFSLVLYL